MDVPCVGHFCTEPSFSLSTRLQLKHPLLKVAAAIRRDYRKRRMSHKVPRRASSPREPGSRSVGRYLLSVENPQDSLSIPNQIPALSTGPRNAHISGRTPPLRGPQVSALANCLSEAAGRERARRNPSAEPDPASAVGPRAPPTTHSEAGRPAALEHGPTPRGTAHPQHPEGARGTRAEVRGWRGEGM